MTNSITLDAMNIGSFYGPIASKYSYTPALRARLDALYQAALRSNNRVFVLDGETCKAAQTTREGALPYMTDTTVLVEVEIPTTTQEQLEQAAKAWGFYPFRKCFIALKTGEDMKIILKPTAHYAGKLAREGWTVRELHHG